MSPTPRLYFEDPLLVAFDARVSAHGTWLGQPSLVLDRTAFYPESGGQMADAGSIGESTIVDVQVDDEGVVHHRIEGPLPSVGSGVHGRIDAARRRLHMALHTGQHMLSRALCDVAGAETVSSRLGETACTIDVDRAELDETSVARAEAEVNSVIDDDVAIRAFFPEPPELAALPLRRQPKVSSNVRVVAIGDYDVSPCGGTHCVRSAQVGLVKVTGIERYKGKMRVTFSAGRRARVELSRQSELLVALGRELTCGPAEVPTALQKLRRELGEARESLGLARARLAELAADELVAAAVARGETRIVAAFDGVDAPFLRAVAKRVTGDTPLVALLAGRSPEGLQVLVARGPKSDFDCGAFLKRLAAASGGRGGGRPEVAEGRLPATIDWASAVAAQTS